MRYISKYLILIIVIFTSCRTSNSFYKTISENKNEFNAMAKYIIENNLLIKNDSIILKDKNSISLKNSCIYTDNNDEFITNFMTKYSLNNICKYEKDDNMIYFTKDAAPYFSSSRIVFDAGSSPLREKIKNGEKIEKDKKLKIIDSTLIFMY